jgi:hypothetical protein
MYQEIFVLLQGRIQKRYYTSCKICAEHAKNLGRMENKNLIFRI